MGQYTASTADAAVLVLTGTFARPGHSDSVFLYGPFNVAVWGTFVGRVRVEKAFDGGSTFIPVGADFTGAANDIAAPISYRVIEAELGVCYRVTCINHTSGTIHYRLSSSGSSANS